MGKVEGMAGSTERRRQEVLRAIVADYIASQQPVGSKTLRERYQIPVSAATIRNDMAVLEREGYIVQEHTSSGRVPTEKAYREFVNSIHEVKPLSPAERRAIIEFLDRGVDLEDVLRRAVQLLSQLTRQAAVVQLPTMKLSHVKHCEVVALTPSRLLLVLITDTGRVEQRNVQLEEVLSEDQVHRLGKILDNTLVGKTMADASQSLADLARHAPSDIRKAARGAATVLIETLVEQPSDRLFLAGASYLFTPGLTVVLEALEEQVIMLKLLANIQDMSNVSVLIGEENEDEQLQETSIVTTAYGAGETPLGAMGVVGPTFMDYSGTISKVSAVARYVSQFLTG